LIPHVNITEGTVGIAISTMMQPALLSVWQIASPRGFLHRSITLDNLSALFAVMIRLIVMVFDIATINA
jgi:hypothetical protein